MKTKLIILLSLLLFIVGSTRAQTLQPDFTIWYNTVPFEYTDIARSYDFPNVYGSPGNDIVYRLDITEPMDLDFSHCGSMMPYSNLYVLDSKFQRIASSAFSSNGQCENIWGMNPLRLYSVKPGTYYIVSEADASVSDPYGTYINTSIRASVPANLFHLGIFDGSFIYRETYDTNLYRDSFQGRPTKDVVHRFILTAPMSVTISHCGSKLEDTYLSLLDSGYNVIASNNDYSGVGACDKPQNAFLKMTEMQPGTYYAVSEGFTADGSITVTIQGEVAGGSGTASNDRNYIITRTPLVETTTASVLTPQNSLHTIQYFDGFGRPTQTVQQGFTPAGKDLVTLQQYDAVGRESRSWLPAVSTGNQGTWTDPATIMQWAANTYAGDSRPFNLPEYESSPLNRVIRSFGPGQDWTDHPVRTDYLANTASGMLMCNLYRVTGDELVCDGPYQAGQLFVTRQTDEENNTTYTFTDKLEQTVLVRQMVGATPHDTYFVYDDFGNLRFVLPPLAADRLVNGRWDISDPDLMLYAYVYRYDARRRCIAKRLPSCDWMYFIYDRGDRPVFSQDGEQRVKGQWMFTIPDAFSRTVLTGICRNVFDHSSDPLRDIVVRGAFRTGGGAYKGYDVTGITLEQPVFLSANFYDSYDFTIAQPFDRLQYVQQSEEFDKRYTGGYKGLLTGTWAAASGGDVTDICSAMYYDIRGRLIQVQSINHLGGVDSEYTAYNFPGQPLKTMRVHTAPGKQSQTEVYSYTYDHAGRALQTRHKLNDGAEVLLADNVYDEPGRLIRSGINQNPSLETLYTYNIRSWTTQLSGELFSQSLSYTPTGNVASMEWITGNSVRGYDFSYDALSRITSARYTGAGKYGTSYEYDKHGNITALIREGRRGNNSFGVTDHLTMSYSGNQLTQVRDAAKRVNYLPSDDFKQNSKDAVAYFYNKNGAMTQDLNKGITDISYNFLNLAQELRIQSPAGNGINKYTYSAEGRKLRTIHQHGGDPLVTDYVGNVIYEDDDLKRILVDGGYWQDGKYHFYLTDHLGNNRVVTDQDGTVIQTNHYYPFGMSFAENTEAEAEAQPYQYNGKEIDRKLGLNLYDYSARYMDPAIGRFTTVDPMAESFYDISPYSYCCNNPLLYIDKNGMWPQWPALKQKVNESISSGLSFINGATRAMADNIAFGTTNLREDGIYSNPTAYNAGQNVGDALTVILGVVETTNGVSKIVGGLLTTPATSGITTGAITSGAIETTHGSVMTYSGGKNLFKQKGRVKESSSQEASSQDKKVNPKKEAREKAKSERNNQPASENYAKYKAKELEKIKGKDARRSGHDAKDKIGRDRSKEELNNDYNINNY